MKYTKFSIGIFLLMSGATSNAATLTTCYAQARNTFSLATAVEFAVQNRYSGARLVGIDLVASSAVDADKNILIQNLTDIEKYNPVRNSGLKLTVVGCKTENID